MLFKAAGLKLLGLVLFAFCAMLLWAFSLRGIEIRRMNDLGLISVLLPSTFLGLVLLTTGFSMTLRRHEPHPAVALLYVVLLIFMLYGSPALVERGTRTPVAWRLVGVMDYIIHHGSVDGRIDGFFDWPGFFILIAFVTKIVGLQSPLPLAVWAPVGFNLLFLCPLLLILRSAAKDERHVWLAVWLFYVTNWIGQDYLAPQSFGYFLYLTIMGILLTWFPGTSRPLLWHAYLVRHVPLLHRLGNQLAPPKMPSQASTPQQQTGLLVIIVMLFTVIVPSHQLTPIATIAGVSTLVMFNRISPRSLPLLMVVITATWISFMTVPYLAGNIHQMTGLVGAVHTNVNENLTQRLRGSPGHLTINFLRAIMSLLVWFLALVGYSRRLRHGYDDLTFALLAATMFPLLALQSYGGELLMRVYLFSLPYMAFFAAALFYPTSNSGTSWRTTKLISLTNFTLLCCCLFARYGNERKDYFTPEEVDAVAYLYNIAPLGSQLIAGTETLPWWYQGYASYKYASAEREVRTANIDRLASRMADTQYPAAYLILTRSEKAAGELFLGWPIGTWEHFEHVLTASGKFEIIFDNVDAQIFVLAHDGEKERSITGLPPPSSHTSH